MSVLILSIACSFPVFMPYSSGADADPIPPHSEPLTVLLKSGTRLKAKLDPRTNNQQLWLKFGDERIEVTRRFFWEEIHEIKQREQVIPFSEVRQWGSGPATADGSPRTVSTFTFPVAKPNPSEEQPSASVFRRSAARVVSVQFDAQLANWDEDVEMDGLIVELWGVGSHGEYIAVDGVLQGELWAMRRIEQDSAPRSGGRMIERVERWTIPLRGAAAESQTEWLRLPFLRRHPEFDTSWSPSGLLHLTVVVPGQGVFHQSMDGVRIRPFAPLRDFLEREGDDRFLPTERTGRY